MAICWVRRPSCETTGESTDHSSFTIGAVVLALSFGKLYATFDAKWLFIGSTVLFLAASALCGAAPSMAAEIIGRVFAGVGGNGMYLGTLTLMIVHTTAKERSGYLALMYVTFIELKEIVQANSVQRRGLGSRHGPRPSRRRRFCHSLVAVGLLHQPDDWRFLSSSLLFLYPCN